MQTHALQGVRVRLSQEPCWNHGRPMIPRVSGHYKSAGGRDGWIRVSKRNPCPKCGKADNCTVSRNSEVCYCGRVSEGSIGQNDGGQWLHRLNDSYTFDPRYLAPEPKERESKALRYGRKAFEFQAAGKPRLPEFAELLGVSAESLDRQRTGWCEREQAITHTEFTPEGFPCGYTCRFSDPTRDKENRGVRGLIIPSNPFRDPGPLFLPEGASGTAALTTLGFCSIGRFNNSGGTSLLIQFLEQRREQLGERPVILIADRDPKPNGKCPGWQGATSVARALAEYTGLTIGVSFPPDNVKDSRDWLLRFRDTGSNETLRQWFSERLEIAYFGSSPSVTLPQEPRPEITLEDAREQLLAGRLESLGRPGVYLDRSECGTGKSHADLLVSIRTVQRGGKAIVILPTHQNCTEFSSDAADMGETIGVSLTVASYPKRSTETDAVTAAEPTCRNPEADECERAGLSVVSAVCNGQTPCQFRDWCRRSGYLAGLARAKDADLVVATTARGTVQGLATLAESREYVAIHEDSRNLLCPVQSMPFEDALAFDDFVSGSLLNDPFFLGTE